MVIDFSYPDGDPEKDDGTRFNNATLSILIKHMVRCGKVLSDCKPCELIHDAWLILMEEKFG